MEGGSDFGEPLRIAKVGVTPSTFTESEFESRRNLGVVCVNSAAYN